MRLLGTRKEDVICNHLVRLGTALNPSGTQERMPRTAMQ